MHTTLLLILATLGSPAAPEEEGRAVRVMSFNIRYKNNRDGINGWAFRRHLVTGAMRWHRAGVIGLQEALPDQLEDIRRALPEYAEYAVGRNADGGGERCALFWDRRKFTRVAAGTFWLSETPERSSRSWKSSLPRICSWVTLRAGSDGPRLHVFNTHFDHRSADARRGGAELVRKKIEAIAGTDPVVLMGDFNTTDTREPYRILTEALRDARDVSEEAPYGPSGTIMGFGRGSRAGRRIDYVFVKNDVRVVQHAILSDSCDGRTPSDHRPIVADLVIGVPFRQVALHISHGWRFQTDPERSGEDSGLHGPGIDDGSWPFHRAGEPWEAQGAADYDGRAWYRREVTLPEAWSEETIHLVAPGIDDAATIWINGARVSDLRKLLGTFRSADVRLKLDNARLKFGEPNLIAICVDDARDFGGLVGFPLSLRTDVKKTTHEVKPRKK